MKALVLALFVFALPVAQAEEGAGTQAGVAPIQANTQSPAMSRETEHQEGTAASVEVQIQMDAGTTSSQAKVGNVEYKWKVEEGESVPPSSSNAAGTVNTLPTKPQEAQADKRLKLDTVDGEYEKTKKSSAAMEADDKKMEVDDKKDMKAKVDPKLLTPDFSMLLGGGSGDEAQKVRDDAADLLLTEMKERTKGGDRPVESLSINVTKIEMKMHDDAMVFGFIPVSLPVSVEVDAEGNAKVKFPWWSFLATGKDEDDIEEQSMTHLGEALVELREAFKKAFMVK